MQCTFRKVVGAMDTPIADQQSAPGYSKCLDEAQSAALAALRTAVTETAVLDLSSYFGPCGGLLVAAEVSEEEVALETTCLLLRFLRARDFDATKAEEFLREDAEWRQAQTPKSVSPGSISNAWPTGCWRMGGRAKDGSPIILIQTGLWDPYGMDGVEEYTRYVSFFMERSISTMRGGTEKHVVLFDMRGWRMNMAGRLPLRMISTLVDIIQNHCKYALSNELTLGWLLLCI